MEFEFVIKDRNEQSGWEYYHNCDCFRTAEAARREAARRNEEEGSSAYVLGPGRYKLYEYGPCHICGMETPDQHGEILSGGCECGAHTIEVCWVCFINSKH